MTSDIVLQIAGIKAMNRRFDTKNRTARSCRPNGNCLPPAKKLARWQSAMWTVNIIKTLKKTGVNHVWHGPCFQSGDVFCPTIRTTDTMTY